MHDSQMERTQLKYEEEREEVISLCILTISAACVNVYNLMGYYCISCANGLWEVLSRGNAGKNYLLPKCAQSAQP